VKSIKKIWTNRKQIFEGIKNYLFRRREIEEISRQRMNICMNCPEIDHEGTKCAAPGTQPCCGSCGCSLAFKTRSIDEDNDCPMGYWNNDEMIDNEHYIY